MAFCGIRSASLYKMVKEYLSEKGVNCVYI